MDDEDFIKLIETISRFKEISGYELYAYCIMKNHIHLLIKEAGESISNALKRICSSYVFWYNKKYERCGHLFQERFKSEVIENDEYFMTVLRYIHQNPTKAGIARDIADYKWSSYGDYVGKSNIVDIDFVLDMFDQEHTKAVELFNKFNRMNNCDVCLEYDEEVILCEQKIGELLVKLGVVNPLDLKHVEKKKRDQIITELKSVSGISVRQISRVTGISKSLIQRA